MKKILNTAAGALAAAAVLTTPVSAYMVDYDRSTESFISDESTWKIITPASADSPFIGATKIQAVVYVDGDTDRYFREKSSGSYEDEDIEDAFGDFTGFLGLGARVSGPSVRNDWWIQFDYHGLSAGEGSAGLAEVTKLDDVTYLLTADLSDITIDGVAGNPSIAVADWGNKSKAYWLSVREVYLYGADGNVVLYSDGEGNMTSDHSAFDISQYPAAAEPAETAAAETAAPETAAETEPPRTTAAETEKAAETTAAAAEANAENTTSEELLSPAETEPAAPSPAPQKNTFGSRDSSLIISAVAAGVIIVAAVIALIIVSLKKKK